MRMLQIASGVDPRFGDPCTIAMHGLSCALAGFGHSVHVVCASETRGQDPSGTPYSLEHVPSLSWARFGHGWLSAGITQALFGLEVAAKLLGRNQPAWDVICFHAATPALLAIKVARIRGVPTVFRYANPLLTQAEGAENGRFDYSALGLPHIVGVLSQLIESSVVADASKVVVASAFAKRRITEHFRVSPAKIAIAPNGVDTASFKPLPRSSQLMERYGLPDTARVVMCVARIVPYKNQMTLIRAVPSILDAVPDAIFVFVGPIDDPTYFDRIQEFVATHDLEDEVVFTGGVDPRLVAQYHCMADVFVLPSLAEGMPLVLLEAMSCGRAIVASSLPQHIEIAEQDDPLLLADPGSVPAIVKAVVDILQDDALRVRLQEKARRLAVRAYDWKVVAQTMLEACTEAVGRDVGRDD